MILTGDPASINVVRHLRINPESRIQMQEKVSTRQNNQNYPGQCVVVPAETASFDRCSRKLSGAPCGRLPLTSFVNSWRILVALVSDFHWAILGSDIVMWGVWRNGSAYDSRSEGWEFESLCPQSMPVLQVARCLACPLRKLHVCGGPMARHTPPPKFQHLFRYALFLDLPP